MGSETQKRVALEKRVDEFRALIRKAIRKADECGAVIRSYDGAISLSWPATVATSKEGRRYVLRLSCSVFDGPTNHYAWRGRSWKDVFARATHDVSVWVEEMKSC